MADKNQERKADALKKLIAACAAFGCAMSLSAVMQGAQPTEKPALAAPGLNRLNPVKVTPAAVVGQPPSDAIVLFDGTQKSLDDNWCDERGGKTRWRLVDGVIESVRSAGYICTRREFGDVQLHVEWQTPACVNGKDPDCGNSGVFLLGDMYEVQVYESYGTNPADMTDPFYADGQAGSIYGQSPPLVNPTRKPGEWQSYDIVFHPPVFEGNTCVHPGTLTVFMNGVLVQDHWDIEGPTWHNRRTIQIKPRSTKGSIRFQDHGSPVHFRNVWARELPSRWAKIDDVKAQRRATADKE